VRSSKAVLALALLACAPAEPSRRVGQPDKRELFGDADLVPTREGERIRRELALADELERLLERASVPSRVTVSLIEPASAVVVAQAGELEFVRSIARAALPGIDEARIHVTITKPDTGTGDREGPPMLLMLTLTLELGLTLGIAVERGWQRFRRPS
jgi:hypothetical protein